jgi:hypothetical protein
MTNTARSSVGPLGLAGFLFLVAVVLFVIALLCNGGWIIHNHQSAAWDWGFGGLIAFAAAHLPWTR